LVELGRYEPSIPPEHAADTQIRKKKLLRHPKIPRIPRAVWCGASSIYKDFRYSQKSLLFSQSTAHPRAKKLLALSMLVRTGEGTENLPQSANPLRSTLLGLGSELVKHHDRGDYKNTEF
jgi:hypothetical protein